MSSLFKKANKTLDASGQLCPVPILMTEEEMAGMKTGEILEVVFTDPGARPDLEAWCKMTGNELMKISWEKTEGSAWLRKA